MCQQRPTRYYRCPRQAQLQAVGRKHAEAAELHYESRRASVDRDELPVGDTPRRLRPHGTQVATQQRSAPPRSPMDRTTDG